MPLTDRDLFDEMMLPVVGQKLIAIKIDPNDDNKAILQFDNLAELEVTAGEYWDGGNTVAGLDFEVNRYVKPGVTVTEIPLKVPGGIGGG